MSFNEKLQKLRKENKYSQEELADLLDVTRQSVSKWESAQTYPEMDKLLAICKIFNCSLEELTNDEIKNISSDKKNNFTSLIDSTLDLINKTYKLLTNMKFIELIKCAFIMFIVAIVLLIFIWPVKELENSFYYMITTLGSNSITTFFSSLFNIILDIIYGILYILIFVYIFKIGFLDKYEFTQISAEEITKAKEIKATKSEVIEERKIIIKEQKEHEYKIFKALGAVATFFVKFFLLCFSLIFIGFVFGLFALLVIDIYLIFKGVFLLSIFLLIIFGILLNILILNFISNIIFNRQNDYRKLVRLFIIGVAGVGISCGIMLIEINTFTYHEDLPNEFKMTTETFEYDYKDKMYFISYNSEIIFIPDNNLNNKITVNVEYYKDFNNVYIYGNEGYYIHNNGLEASKYKNYINLWIKYLSKKEVFDFHRIFDNKVTIYASETIINKLNNNFAEYLEEEQDFQNMINSYENTIFDLNEQINKLNEELIQSEYDKDELKFQIEQLKLEIDEYKNRIQDLLN